MQHRRPIGSLYAASSRTSRIFPTQFYHSFPNGPKQKLSFRVPLFALRRVSHLYVPHLNCIVIVCRKCSQEVTAWSAARHHQIHNAAHSVCGWHKVYLGIHSLRLGSFPNKSAGRDAIHEVHKTYMVWWVEMRTVAKKTSYYALCQG
jgi:hypothetical protein